VVLCVIEAVKYDRGGILHADGSVRPSFENEEAEIGVNEGKAWR